VEGSVKIYVQIILHINLDGTYNYKPASPLFQ